MGAASGASRRRRTHRRGPFGGVEVATILVVLFAVVGIPLVIRVGQDDSFGSAADAIDAEEVRAPLGEPDWKTANLDFASAQMPGEVREVPLDPDIGKKATAAVVGGHGRGVAVVEVQHDGDPSSGQAVATRAGLISALGEELGIEHVESYGLIGDRQDGTYQIPLGRADPDLVDGRYFIRTEASLDDQVISVRSVVYEGREFLVLATWPGLAPAVAMATQIADSLEPA